MLRVWLFIIKKCSVIYLKKIPNWIWTFFFRAEFEKTVVSENDEESTDSKSVDENIPPANVDEKSDRKSVDVKKIDGPKIVDNVEPSEADTVIMSSSSEAEKPLQPAAIQPKSAPAVQPKPAVGRLTSHESESEEEEVVEVGESDDDSDFCPGLKKKEQQQPKVTPKPGTKIAEGSSYCTVCHRFRLIKRDDHFWSKCLFWGRARSGA